MRSRFESGRCELLGVLYALEAHVLLGLLSIGTGLGELGFSATNLLLERRRVEEDQKIALLDHAPLGCQGYYLRLVALDL